MRYIMEKQILYIKPYKWKVTIFYDTKPQDVGIVIDILYKLGCSEDEIEKSYRNITSGDANNGLTYSNIEMRESVLSLGYTDSKSQFLNTFSHELTHLCQHICKYYNISPYGEEAAYLAGDIGQRMFPVARKFICGHCRKRLGM